MRPLLWLALTSLASAAPRAIPFDTDWRFQEGHIIGQQKPAFGDSTWQTVRLPHDWSIEDPFDENNRTGGAGAFLPAGMWWYQKHFASTPELAGKRVFIEFDGVMANSDVGINGDPLGHRPYGYVSFQDDLTGHLKPQNVITVLANNEDQPASRWYAGAGIYRHVRLLFVDPVHIAHWAT